MLRIERLMSDIGITTNYKGYYYLTDALQMCLKREPGQIRITKEIYPQVATKHGATSFRVEQNIRFAKEHSYSRRKDKLDEIAGFTLDKIPSNTEFLIMLTEHLRKTDEETPAPADPILFRV